VTVIKFLSVFTTALLHMLECTCNCKYALGDLVTCGYVR